MIKFFLIYLFTNILFAQVDWKPWQKKDVDYQIVENQLSKNDFNMEFFGVLHFVYKTFISDLDGDNCPFEPSCSNFFMQAYKETNLIKASLMFADRFMRDTNFFNRDNYQMNSRGKLIDFINDYK